MIAGIVLAAGKGARFGGAKLMQPLQGRPLICHAVVAALRSRLDQVLVVRPAEHPEMEALLEPTARLAFLENPDPERGQMSSLKIALGSVAGSAEAVVVLLADMPLIPPALIEELIDSFRNDGHSALPICEGEWRHPRLLAAELFPEFLELADDARGNVVLEARRPEIREVPSSDPQLFLDVDRPEDLAQVERLLTGA